MKELMIEQYIKFTSRLASLLTGVWTYSDSRISVRHDIFRDVTFQEVSNGCFADFFSEQGNQV